VWPRKFGHIRIIEIQKHLVVKTRRLVKPDGSTVSFDDVEQCEMILDKFKLVMAGAAFIYESV